ncbi:MAG: PTS sugar transporter subunit IIA [Gemmataceae bacterium]
MAIHRQPACIPPIIDAHIPPDIAGRDEVIAFLLQELVSRGLVTEERVPAMFAGLRDREAIGSTSIGRGVAVPHLRVAGLDEFRVVLGRSVKGIIWPGAMAGQSVHQVYLVLSPQEQPGAHLRLLEYISRTAGNG